MREDITEESHCSLMTAKFEVAGFEFSKVTQIIIFPLFRLKLSL